MSKESLKNLLKIKVQEAAFQELLASKSSLSKMSDLKYDKLIMQPYLSINSVSNTHKRLEFSWRTKMLKVNWNYGLKINCPLCHEEEDTQRHLLRCSYLINQPNKTRDEETIFSMAEIEKLIRKREIILEENKSVA